MHRGLFALLCLALAPLSVAQTEGEDPSAEIATKPPTPAELGYREALILGIVEGITEYLPISSTGHLLLTNQLLGLNSDLPVTDPSGVIVLDREGEPYSLKRAADAYAIIIQAGAILAVIVLYWRRLRSVLAGLLGRDPRGLRLGINLLVAFLPAAVLGLLFNDWIEELLFGPLPIAIALAAGGVLMWAVERWRRRTQTPVLGEGVDLPEMALSQCLMIGLLQCVAMWPGTSRSMMTIVGGYLVGLSPRRAAEFSFLLGLITLSAAASYKTVKDGREMLQVLELGPVLFGTLVAFIAAALAIKWLIAFLSRHGLGLFAGYRLILALLVVIFMV
ncbi:MAG: undecaprenyl-diphosphate phosphatase [Opitutales bacterium]